MLTTDEIIQLQTVQYFGPYWGTAGEGLCPCGKLAELRGVLFKVDDNIYGYDFGNKTYIDVVWKAVADFRDAIGAKSNNELYELLEKEDKDILRRIKNDNTV